MAIANRDDIVVDKITVKAVMEILRNLQRETEQFYKAHHTMESLHLYNARIVVALYFTNTDNIIP